MTSSPEGERRPFRRINTERPLFCQPPYPFRIIRDFLYFILKKGKNQTNSADRLCKFSTLAPKICPMGQETAGKRLPEGTLREPAPGQDWQSQTSPKPPGYPGDPGHHASLGPGPSCSPDFCPITEVSSESPGWRRYRWARPRGRARLRQQSYSFARSAFPCGAFLFNRKRSFLLN